MTIRGGGRPRDQRDQAPLEDESYADAAWMNRDARRAASPAARNARRGGGAGGLLRFLLFMVILAAIVLAGLLTVLRPVVSGVIVDWAYDNPGALRFPFVADIVRERLGPELTDPASADATEIEFEIVSGDTPRTLANRLKAEDLIKSERAFIFEATRRELAPKLQAGNYHIPRNLTPDGVVTALVSNRIVITVVPVNFREGLRLEQITAKLQTLKPPVKVDPQEFYDIVKKPPATLLADYPWLTEAGLPEGASLEGFLAPATYDIVAETTAEELVRQMLDAFYKQVGPDRMAVPSSRGMSFYEILTLGSIVEREAVLDDERWLIAGVYQYRIDGGNRTRLLEADPTVLYAIDRTRLDGMPFASWKDFLFWSPKDLPPLGTVELPEALAGYNTYKVRGLPPGPICTPSVASIDAALEPDTSEKYLFFLAIPNSDPPGAHDFSKTLAEHNEKKKQYGYT